MKKIKYLVMTVISFFVFSISISANTLNSINAKINIDNYGTMHVIEVWDMLTYKDTEIYKQELNLGSEMAISNFKVSDENQEYSFNPYWNIKESFENKKYKYGYNKVNNGIELCWGISEYGKKTYTISYDITNAVFNTSDAQVLYMKLINDLDFPPKEFEIIIEGAKIFEDTLDVWGYGYYGRAYVHDGKIYMSSKRELSKGEYGVLLVKFPQNYFLNINTSNSYYSTFEDVFNKANNGAYKQDYGETENVNNSNNNEYQPLIIFAIISAIGIAEFFYPLFKMKKRKYAFSEYGKTLNMSEIMPFRDIPCNKDIYKAYFVSQMYYLAKTEDIFGAIYLKWILNNKIKIMKEITVNSVTSYVEDTTIGENNKTKRQIVLSEQTQFDNRIDKEYYSFLQRASTNNVIKENDLKEWSKNNSGIIYLWFKRAERYGIDCYQNENVIKGKKILSPQLEKDAIELAGLKKFLTEFSRISEKEPIEVKLWKDYLIYAQIFGIADKVAEKLKRFYPEVCQFEVEGFNFDDICDFILSYDSVIYSTKLEQSRRIERMNSIIRSVRSINSSSSRDFDASDYHSGGGGFSSGGGGGGGGGSFGGGGGGSR